jgi:hypothetical protein
VSEWKRGIEDEGEMEVEWDTGEGSGQTKTSMLSYYTTAE